MDHLEPIKILQGEEAQAGLDDQALIHLVNRVNELEVDDIVGEECHVIATRIHQSLASERTKGKLIESIDPKFGPIEHMKKLRELGHIAIAKDGERTVGMVGFERCGELKGRNVYEIRRMAVRKELEGQFISLRLYKAIMEKLLAEDPNALVLVDSQNPVVSKQCERMGYEPINALDGLTIKIGKERAEQSLAEYEKQGGQFFLYDPSSAAAASDKD